MHLNTANNRIKTTQRGFSLVEVLVALIIMSVGMLGIAGLYVQSMQAGRTSMLRHNAVTLAGDVADRIRSNPRAGNAYTDPEGADNGCVNGGIACVLDACACCEQGGLLCATTSIFATVIPGPGFDRGCDSRVASIFSGRGNTRQRAAVECPGTVIICQGN